MPANHQARRATFIGIGAQKTASTWLHSVLSQLDGIAISEPKEVDFFSAYYDRGYEWYEGHFPERTPSVHRGDVSPSYFADRDAPARAAAYNSTLKILVTLRDPVDRAYSNHLHEVRAGHASGPNEAFAQALAANNPMYLEQGFYAKHLKAWLEHFGRDQMLVLFQEDIRRDSEREARRIADFLAAPMPREFVDRQANASVDYNNRTIGNAIYRMGNLARRSGLGGTVERTKRMPVIRQLMAANYKPMRHAVAPMSETTERQLTEAYRSDVAELATLTGQIPPWPRFARGPAETTAQAPALDQRETSIGTA